MSARGNARRDLAPEKNVVAKGKSKPKTPEAAMPFKSDEEVLEIALAMIRSLDDCSSFARRPLHHQQELELTTQRACDLSRIWHERLSLTPESVFIAGLCRRLRLSRVEREVLVALLLDAMGLNPIHLGDASDLMQLFALRKSGAMAAQQAVSEGGKLYRKGILFYDDPDAELCDRKVLVDPGILQSALRGRGAATPFAALKREEDLHEALAPVTGAMKYKSDELLKVIQGYSQADFQKHQRKLAYLLRQLDDLLKERPQWKLSQLRSKWRARPQDWVVLLALLGKALLHAEPESSLYTGAGLSRAISDNHKQFKSRLQRLMSNAPLVRGGYIQPCGGGGSLISESPESIQDAEYELTEKSLALLGIGKAVGARAKRDEALRDPKMSLEDLALPETSLSSIRLALDHVQHADKLMNKWGLRTAFPYGTGVTMLFYGPPGTGKTATAEAIAHELGMPLLVADYAKIQNCWVGQTEKNISATFRKARQHRAVLFWDEADAMFFDRDSASRTWEVRDVNVLLQEIERFEGVCILATNRKATLDKALERRITAKIEFPRPDRALRESIWKRLLPSSMPLAKDVNFTELSQKDLSGGEIKNVILNAARAACGRKGKAPVSMDDFRRALDQEVKGSWATPVRKPAGFLIDHHDAKSAVSSITGTTRDEKKDADSDRVKKPRIENHEVE
jgi:AAA+ superfamily predicted ATPase